MKITWYLLRRLLILTIVACTGMGMGTASATNLEELSEKDRKMFNNALNMMESGMLDGSEQLLTSLIRAYPENRIVMYELTYTYILQKEYEKAYQWAKKLIKVKDADADSYFMAGNAFDYAGYKKEAVEIYEKGLKKFPQSGRLWVEKGNTALVKGDANEAVRCYQESVERDPDYNASYFRLAALYSQSTEPVWGIMYGQDYQLRGKYERQMAVSKLIYNIYRAAIVRTGKGGGWKCMFASGTRQAPYPSSDCDVPFEYFFHIIHQRVVDADSLMTQADTLTVEDVARLHYKYVEMADSLAHDYYDVPSLALERAALHAGHLRGYIWWMLRGALPQDAKIETRNKEMQAFVDWYGSKYAPLHQARGVIASKTTISYVMPIPRPKDLATALACRQLRNEIKTATKWWLEADPDPLSALQRKITNAMIAWVEKTDEFTITISASPLIQSITTLPYLYACAIDYYFKHKKSHISGDDYVNVLMQVATQLRKHRTCLNLSNEAIQLIDMEDDALRENLKNMYQKKR
ncbi:MAG: tetratricopeptide repeat protein [Sodaliphilus sp.]